MNEDLISIIVPIYNAENNLDKCIESILSQTYKKLEIILINDGSTDKSAEICLKYLTDKRVKLINNHNMGLSKSRQAGIELSNGKYLCTIDADDFIQLDYIEKLYKSIKFENSDISVCGFRVNNKNKTDLALFKRYNPVERLNETRVEQNFYELAQKYYMSDSWNKLYKKEFIVLSNVKFNHKKEYIGTDLLFNYKLLLNCPTISVVNEPLYNYNSIPDSFSKKDCGTIHKSFNYIIESLIETKNKLKYTDLINEEITKIYIGFCHGVLVNCFDKKSTNKYKKLKNFLETHKNFIKKNNILKPKSSNFKSIFMKFFILFLNSSSILNIYILFTFRNKLLNFMK